METLKKKILNILKSKKIFVEDLSFLAGDASDRKYFLAKYLRKKVVIMFDANKKDLYRFLKITKSLDRKISVPKVYDVFKEDGLAVIENFGNSKYSKIINKNNSKELYQLAVENLIFIQKQKISIKLPQYDIPKFLDESNLFFDWYLPFFRIKKKNIKDEFNFIFKNFFKKLNKLPQVFVHRDYHIDNLFFSKIEQGILNAVG